MGLYDSIGTMPDATSLSLYNPGMLMDANNNVGGFIAGSNLSPMNGVSSNPLTFKDKAGLALAGLQTIGGLYAAFKQLGLANRQFAFQKDFANRNMANSIKTYNTALEDRARARAAMEGQTPEQAQAYIDKNRMAAWNGG